MENDSFLSQVKSSLDNLAIAGSQILDFIKNNGFVVPTLEDKMLPLTGKNMVVIGGSQGIGRSGNKTVNRVLGS